MKKTTKKTSSKKVVAKKAPLKKVSVKKPVEGLLDPVVAQAEALVQKATPTVNRLKAQASQSLKTVSKKTAPLMKTAKAKAEQLMHDAEPYLQEGLKKAQEAAQDAKPFVAKTVKNLEKAEKKIMKDASPYVKQGMNFFQKAEFALQNFWKQLNGTQKLLVVLLAFGSIAGLGYGTMVTNPETRPEGSMIISADVGGVHSAADTAKANCNQ